MADLSNSSESSTTNAATKEKHLIAHPSLSYSLHTRKRSIAIIWITLIVITSVQVEFFYFVLRYSAHTKPDIALTVPTAILLALSVLSIGYRTWQLAHKGSLCRPIGGAWYSLDYFHINVLLGFIIVTAVLAQASGQDPPNIRQSSLPQSIILLLAGSQLVLTGVLAHFHVPSPIRLSSTARGSMVRPGVFVLVEDVVAVDGGGGEVFRKQLTERYEASPILRRAMVRLNWFWGVGSCVVAGGTIGIVYGLRNTNVGFALGWSIPWAWAGIASTVTMLYVKMMLRQEQDGVEFKASV